LEKLDRHRSIFQKITAGYYCLLKNLTAQIFVGHHSISGADHDELQAQHIDIVKNIALPIGTIKHCRKFI
jgi:hypothetical protein